MRDPEKLLRDLRRHLPAEGDATAVIPLSIGHSSETYIVQGADLVLRMPPSEEPLFGPLYAPVDAQYAVLAELGGRPGPPVPKVVELCTDEQVLGAPFMLMERVDGEAFERELPEWLTDADEAFRSSLSEQWVDALVQTHRLEPLDALGASLTTCEEWGRWRHLADLAHSDALVRILDDLIAANPPASGPPAVVHGDPKMANVLWREGCLATLLDWEIAFNGDPLNDLGYALTFVPNGKSPGYPGYELPGFWSRERIIDVWEQRTGRTAERIDLYLAAGLAKIASIVAYGVRLYEDGRSTDERFARWKPAVDAYVDRIERGLA